MRTLFAGLVLILITSCAFQPTPNVAAKVRQSDDRVFVQQITETTRPDGEMKIDVTGKSLSPFPIVMEYRVNWYDANGQLINTTISSWERRQLRPSEVFEFTAVGPGSRARSYSLDFRSQ